MRLVLALTAASVACLALLAGSFRLSGDFFFWFMSWNLFLAFVPLVMSLWLGRILRRKLWSSWQALGVTTLWLLFLPNSFYVASDFVHLKHVPDDQLMYQLAMIGSFTMLSFIFGLMSLGSVHEQLVKRFRNFTAAGIVGIIILLCSFAVYLGRDLRWNSWDVLINPFSLLLDVSDRLLYPAAHPVMLQITGSFFLLIAGTYAVYWHLTRYLRLQPKS
jgi:uncharacterized membrane protein